MPKNRPLYCKCGGLVKTKTLQVNIKPQTFRQKINMFYNHLTTTKAQNYYVCNRCGKRFY